VPENTKHNKLRVECVNMDSFIELKVETFSRSAEIQFSVLQYEYSIEKPKFFAWKHFLCLFSIQCCFRKVVTLRHERVEQIEIILEYYKRAFVVGGDTNQLCGIIQFLLNNTTRDSDLRWKRNFRENQFQCESFNRISISSEASLHHTWLRIICKLHHMLSKLSSRHFFPLVEY
jgi:hypothetical protein